MTGSQIRAALRQDERLQADPALWDRIKVRARQEMPAAFAEKHRNPRPVLQRAMRRATARYAAMAACALTVAVSVAALLATGQKAGPFAPLSGGAGFRPGSSATAAGNSSAGGRQQTGGASVGSSSSSSFSSSKPSRSSSGGAAGPTSGAGPGVSSVAANTASGSGAGASSSSDPKGELATESSANIHGNAASIPDNPFFLSYGSRIYSTSGVFGFQDSSLVTPGPLLGHFSTSTGDAFSGRAVYAVNGQDPASQLCIPDVSDSTKFGKYSYLCNRTFSLNGTTYSLSGEQVTDVNATPSMRSEVNGPDTTGVITGSNAKAGCSVASPQANAVSHFTASPVSDCVLSLLLYPSSDIATHLRAIGSIPVGTAYSISGIDPAAAIVMSGNGRWFLAVATNNKNKSYGDLQNLIAQKGLTLKVSK